MSAYIIVDIDVRDAESYDRYKAAAPSSIALNISCSFPRGATTATALSISAVSIPKLSASAPQVVLYSTTPLPRNPNLKAR